jgi:manganese efflux pump family protein
LTFWSILALSLGLAMDATAVSAAKGLAVPRVLPRHVALVAVFFGGSQALMPLVGWGVGARLGPFVDAYAHWIAFGLLAAIGGKMLWEARPSSAVADPARPGDAGDPFAVGPLSLLAVATSIDALAVGVSLPMLNAPLALTLVTIGLTTAATSALGLYAGRRFGALLGRRLDAAGGLVLIGLGVKLLVEHRR